MSDTAPEPPVESNAKVTIPGERDRAVELVSRHRECDALAGRSRALSRWRLGGFGVAVIGLFATIDSVGVGAALVGAGTVAFAVAFWRHSRVLDALGRATGLLTLANEAQQRQHSRRRERPSPAVAMGASPLELGRSVHAPELEAHEIDEHVADDLGLFTGPRSLYGFLDWTSSTFGSRRLRRILARLVRDSAALRDRQQAVAEIASRHELRETMLLGLLPLRPLDLAPLGRLFGQPVVFADRRRLALIVTALGTLAPLVLIALIVTGELALFGPLVILAAINFTVIGTHARTSNRVRDRLLLLRPLLDALDKLSRSLGAADLEAEEWQRISAAFAGAAPAVRELRGHLTRLAFHSYGPVFEVFNILVMWELRILPRAERVFVRRRTEIEVAAGALAESEALVCLALPLAEHACFSMPKLLEGDEPQLTAAELGHPLLEPESCVHNSLELGGAGGRIWILTGSNMSGKSTYLRSVGQNLVLASCGGPVCAKSFSWTPLALHSDVNVRDSLDDGKSYFQVEVERVRLSLEHARGDRKMLLLCDEMFRGTNSDERLAISRAVVHDLARSGALAIVATHDRSLARLAATDRDDAVSNHHLRDLVEDGVMRFDYRLRSGIAPTRNAVRVLERQGYPPELVAEARKFLDEDAEEA